MFHLLTSSLLRSQHDPESTLFNSSWLSFPWEEASCKCIQLCGNVLTISVKGAWQINSHHFTYSCFFFSGYLLYIILLYYVLYSLFLISHLCNCLVYPSGLSMGVIKLRWKSGLVSHQGCALTYSGAGAGSKWKSLYPTPEEVIMSSQSLHWKPKSSHVAMMSCVCVQERGLCNLVTVSISYLTKHLEPPRLLLNTFQIKSEICGCSNKIYEISLTHDLVYF